MTEDRKETEMVSIPKKQFEKLLNDQRLLQCLRNNGVDNWDFWDDSLSAFNAGEGE